MLTIKDSLTGSILPIKPHDVSIYACGITPYSPSHVGHARTYVIFDLLANVLRHAGHTVRLVRNITDIDDKIINAARDLNTPWHEHSEFYAAQNRSLMTATGLQIPEEPKASQYLPEMFTLIEALQRKELAYVAGTGDVLYRVEAYKGTVLMAHQEGSLRSEQGDTRVNASGKEDPRDFALWKKVPANEVGFESPWGWGRPGWHIECSAMIGALFNGSVTIHGGGVDLKFPHHQAEMMQSQPVYGKPLADVWMHNGSVLSNGQKMSKSLGNYVTWSDALAQANTLSDGLGGDVLRMAMLQTHWQKPLDWTNTLLQSTYDELLQWGAGTDNGADVDAGFVSTLLDNLNTPKAWTWLRQEWRAGRSHNVIGGLRWLGVDVKGWTALHHKRASEQSLLLERPDVKALWAQRVTARDAKQWDVSDALRKELQGLGVIVNDKAL